MPLNKIYKMPTQSLLAFLATFIGGYIFHLYTFTNSFPNSDGINRVYDLQEMTVSGRWFLHYATFPSGFMQMPAFIGLLSLIFLGFSAILIVTLLEIKHNYLAMALGLSFIAFPSVGFTFLYLFTASAYSIGIFLAILSVWLTQKGGKYWILSSVLLAFSMGIYQAYAPFAIGLSVLLVMKKTVSPNESLKSVTTLGLKLMAFLATGAGLYYLILQIILTVTGQELLPYLGMEESGAYPFSSLPSLVISCYKQVILFFFFSGTGTTTGFLAVFNLTIIILGVIGLYFLLTPYLKEKEHHWRILAILILCCILPLALGFVQIISPFSAPTPLMQYPYVLAYTVVLFFADNGLLKCPISLKKNYLYGISLNIIIISLSSGWLCNLLYTASNQAHRATESYVTRMMTRVESTDGYFWNMPLLVIGAYPEDRFYANIEAYSLIDHYSVPVNSVLPLNKHIYYYLNHWLNLPISEPTEETMIAMSHHPEFLEMPLYPDDGSVKIIDDKMVVRVGETYTPKSDYEIAYENRK